MPWWGWLLLGWCTVNTALAWLVHLTTPVMVPRFGRRHD